MEIPILPDSTNPVRNRHGSGWYYANTIANVSLKNSYIPINQSSRLVFYDWSSGNQSNNTKVIMNAPAVMTADFRTQYLVTIHPENAYGENISNVGYYNISSKQVNSSTFYAFENKVYNIEYIYYKGIAITTNYRFNATRPTSIALKTPVYNVTIYTQSVFGSPINTSLNMTFRNNTTINTYSGEYGLYRLNNVPYGHVTGYAEYLGIKESVNADNGFNPSLTFLTLSLIGFILGGILLIVVVAKITQYYERRPKSKIAQYFGRKPPPKERKAVSKKSR